MRTMMNLAPTSAAQPTKRPARRLAAGALLAVSVLSLTWGGAQAQVDRNEDGASAVVDLDISNGSDIDAALAAVGMDAAWRAASGLNEVAVSVRVCLLYTSDAADD